MPPRTAPVIERLRFPLFSLALASAFACGSDDSRPAAGEELGPCVEGYCLGELVCVRERCVDPTEAEGQDTETPPFETSDGGAPPDETSGSGAESEDLSTEEPWCTRAADTHCICGLTEDYAAPDIPCSPDVLPDPALCCATPGWPVSDSACSCTTPHCRKSGNWCGCLPNHGGEHDDEIVESCEPPPGGTCCLDGADCRCSDLPECGDTGVPVDACDVTLLSCSAPFEPVDACNEGMEA